MIRHGWLVVRSGILEPDAFSSGVGAAYTVISLS
jgi:hypothetical protein